MTFDQLAPWGVVVALSVYIALLWRLVGFARTALAEAEAALKQEQDQHRKARELVRRFDEVKADSELTVRQIADENLRLRTRIRELGKSP